MAVCEHVRPLSHNAASMTVGSLESLQPKGCPSATAVQRRRGKEDEPYLDGRLSSEAEKRLDGSRGRGGGWEVEGQTGLKNTICRLILQPSTQNIPAAGSPPLVTGKPCTSAFTSYAAAGMSSLLLGVKLR